MVKFKKILKTIISYLNSPHDVFLNGEIEEINESDIPNNKWVCPKCKKTNENSLFSCEYCGYSTLSEIEKFVQRNEFNLLKNTVNGKWLCPKCKTVNDIFLPCCKKCGVDISDYQIEN